MQPMKMMPWRWYAPFFALSLLGCFSAAGLPSTGSWHAEAAAAAAALQADDAATAQKHLQRAFNLAEKQDVPPSERARLLVLLGKAYWQASEPQRAARTFERALAVAEEAPATDELLLLRAEALTELGNHYFSRRPQEGRKALEEALRLRRQLLAPAAPEILESLELLGLVYAKTGDLEQAEELLREAAALVAGSPTASPEEKAGPLFTLSAILEWRGQQAEADDVREKALRMIGTSGP